MKRLPDAVVVVDANHEITAVREARLLEIPVIGIVDTNTDPNCVDHPIPANDDSIRTIQLIMSTITDEILTASGKENAPEEPVKVKSESKETEKPDVEAVAEESSEEEVETAENSTEEESSEEEVETAEESTEGEESEEEKTEEVMEEAETK